MAETEANQAGDTLTPPVEVEPSRRLVRPRQPAEGPTVAKTRRARPRKAPATPRQHGPAPGWQRLVLRNRHGLDRDCVVLDDQGKQLFYVASGFFLRSKGVVRSHDRDGSRVLVLRGKVLDVPMQIVIRRPDGTKVARVSAKWRSPLVSPIRIRLADGTEWETIGSLAKRQYAVAAAGKPVIQVDQKRVQIRDSCKVEVADGVDPALAAAIVWAIDELLRD